MAGTLTVTGMSSGLPTGEKVFGPITVSGSATIDATIDITLASGDNTISVPTGATVVVIVPPSANTQALKVRTNLNSGDTGLSIDPASLFGPWKLAAGTTSIILNAGGATTGFTAVYFV